MNATAWRELNPRADAAVRVSVCIVNWNTRASLAACLRSLNAQQLPEGVEILVVDNASTDGSVQMVKEEFPQVRLFPLPANIMLGPGMNVAAAQASGRYLLFLNSDTEVTQAQVLVLSKYLDSNPQVGACSPREKNARGKLWPLPIPPVTVTRLLLQFFGGRGLLRRFSPALGAQQFLACSCVMLRAAVGDQVGYFDPDFIFYYEDSDLCTRIRKAGYELHVVPGVTTLHLHATSSKNVDRGLRLVWITKGFCRYVRKHNTGSSARLLLGVAMLVALFESACLGLATVLTLGLSKKKRQRFGASPKVIGLLFTNLCGPVFKMKAKV